MLRSSVKIRNSVLSYCLIDALRSRLLLVEYPYGRLTISGGGRGACDHLSITRNYQRVLAGNHSLPAANSFERVIVNNPECCHRPGDNRLANDRDWYFVHLDGILSEVTAEILGNLKTVRSAEFITHGWRWNPFDRLCHPYPDKALWSTGSSSVNDRGLVFLFTRPSYFGDLRQGLAIRGQFDSASVL